uniref:Poly [ADP-ribose] polymerase n=1 Tax=Leptobrachium leishanense TaxID=445787 RepID=A0A8C5MXR2_9ANUR
LFVFIILLFLHSFQQNFRLIVFTPVGVSGAILHAAGQTVADECALYGTLYHGNVVVTSGGNLKSNHIMHMISPAGLSAFASTLDTILTECKNRSFRTVALPAIGTEPDKWSPMDGQIHKEVELLRYSAEYKTVADKFTKSAIIPIKRIQNVGLWQKYSFNKFIVDQQYPGQKNEKHLYHGTDYSTAEKISLHGFNRAFCGKHGVSYGKGTYFAKDASYSCDDRYSVKDQNGEKHVYQAAVITGKWCQSDPIYVEPPPTAEDPKVLYNTTVDNVKYPTIFVVYHDNCVYPEYMITFTSS